MGGKGPLSSSLSEEETKLIKASFKGGQNEVFKSVDIFFMIIGRSLILPHICHQVCS